MAKMVRNTVECKIQIGSQEPFTATGETLAENSELGREFAKGFVRQDMMQRYDGSNEAYGVPARVLSTRIVKAEWDKR